MISRDLRAAIEKIEKLQETLHAIGFLTDLPTLLKKMDELSDKIDLLPVKDFLSKPDKKEKKENFKDSIEQK